MNRGALNFFLVFGVCAMITSCVGQVNIDGRGSKKEKRSIGTVISELSEGTLIMFQDSRNNYWFASQGVVRYDGNNFTQFTKEDGLYSNGIRGIREDQLGNIYFDTGEGINKYNGHVMEKLSLVEDLGNEWKLGPNDLWFEGDWNKNGVFRYDGKKLYHLKFPKHELEDEFYSRNPNASFSPYDVYKTYKDSKGHIWFGTSTFGACRFDGKSLNWISEREMTEIDGGSSPGVRSILEDKDGHLWFSSNLNHKYKIISNNDTPLIGAFEYRKIDGIDNTTALKLGSSCMSIAQDNDGAIWMATYDAGVWKYDGQNIEHYPILLDGKDVLIFSIYKDNQGDIWVGTHNAGAMKFNGETFIKFDPNNKK